MCDVNMDSLIKKKSKKINEKIKLEKKSKLIKKKKSNLKKKSFQFNKPETIIGRGCNEELKSILNSPEIILSAENGDEADLDCFLDESKRLLKRCNSKVISAIEEETIEKDSLNACQLYFTSKGAVMVLKESSVLYIHGLLELTILYGSVTVLGKTLDKNSVPAKIFSPRGSSYLSIVNNNIKDAKPTKYFAETLQKFSMSQKDSLELTKSITSNIVIAFCKPISNKCTNFLEKYTAQKMYPPIQNEMQCIFRSNVPRQWSVFQYDDQWIDIDNSICDESKMMLCGGKGVGKSTLLRYLLNRLLERFPKVIVIDLDPGQAEFTVPGCVSAFIIEEPVFGPNYTHLKKPEKCFYIPSLDVSEVCEEYIFAIRELMKTYRDFSKYPTLINYMGFTKGIGLNIVSTVINIVQPTDVVQIQSTNEAKNFACDLTPSVIACNKGLFGEENDNEVNFNLIKISSRKGETSSWELEPRQVRELCILAYFSQVLTENSQYLTERDVKIYSVSLANIKIICNGRQCKPMVANAQMVALCSNLGDSDLLLDCLGWGIVRGVCLKTKVLYLLTPLEETQLEKVWYLAVGPNRLPPSIYIQNDTKVQGLVPYVYKGNTTNFAQPPKRSFLTPSDLPKK